MRNNPPPGERPFKRPRLASKYSMDPSFSSSSSTPSHRPNLQHPRTTSANSTVDRQRPNDSRSEDTLRRGHSDGDVLSNGSKSKSRIFTEPASAEREAWMDVLRQSPSGRQVPLDRAQLAASRAAIMAADRKKRLSEHPEEHSRRRSSSGLSFVHPGASRSRQSLTQPGDDRPLFGPSTNPSSPPTPGITEQPSPRRPRLDNFQNRGSREIALPRWEPDAGVSKCPICGTTFSFWYRKHHCRKCGRVVCANCSPHRITIPRQFIVRPPEDAPPSPSAANNAGVEVVDLTSDDDAPGDVVSPEERPQSSEYRIDPALGGGQEVRLCNPCVPDPNPLPHLPYLSTTRHTFNSFPRPDGTSPNQQLPPIPGLSSSGEDQVPTLSRRVSSGRSEYRSNNGSRFDGIAPLAALTTPGAGSSTNRRHSHASRPVGSPISLPGYPSVYGSAPDQTAHQRHLASLLQTRPHHRHHASLGPTPSPSRYRPLPDLDMANPRPAPRPQLREEDECPVCHQALPPKGPDGSEAEREAHVESCIATHFSSSGPRSSHPPASAATAAAIAASAATPSQAAGPRPTSTGHRDSAGSFDISSSSSSFQQRMRTPGMFVYHASEKDCVGQDGEGVQECVICFEEFAVGDEMGRLVCLCKFHRACIRQWWVTKGAGACPVHTQAEI